MPQLKLRFTPAPRMRITFLKILLAAGGVLLASLGLEQLADAYRGQSLAPSESFLEEGAPIHRAPVLQGFHLSAPRLGVDRYVLVGGSAANLRLGPAWLEQTTLPGTQGNCVIAAHRETHFRFLRLLKLGDEIVVTLHDRAFHYSVKTIAIVGKDDTRLLASSSGSQLTLVTCFPFYFAGPAPRRFIIQAVPLHPPSLVSATSGV